MKNKFTKKLLMVLKIFFLISIPFSVQNSSADIINYNKLELLSIQQVNTINEMLFFEVDNYINKQSRGRSKLQANILINKCSFEDFDLVLALAQAHIESHFGTKGVASRTNSVFNVGTFDNGIILYKYSNPNESILPYISLLKRRYLKTTSSIGLLKPKAFVNDKGKRYASLKSYEFRVKKIYDSIKNTTNIDSLWNIYQTGEFKKSFKLYSSAEEFYCLINDI